MSEQFQNRSRFLTKILSNGCLFFAAAFAAFLPQNALAVLPPACWKLVNGANNTTTSNKSVTPWSINFSNALTNHSLIVVGISNVGSTVINTPTDTAGNTYYDSGAGEIYLGGSNSWGLRLYYALNNYTTASNTITETAPGSGGQISIIAQEWTGALIASLKDQETSVQQVSIGGATGQNISMGPFTPTQGGELIVAFLLPESDQPIQGSMWPGQGYCAYPVGSGNNCATYGFAFMNTAVQQAAAAFTGTWSDADTGDVYSGIMMSFRGNVCNPPHAGIM